MREIELRALRSRIPDEERLRTTLDQPENLNHWGLIEDYQNGTPINELSKKYSISIHAIRRRLKSENVESNIPRASRILQMIKDRKFMREQQQILDYYERNPDKGVPDPKRCYSRFK